MLVRLNSNVKLLSKLITNTAPPVSGVTSFNSRTGVVTPTKEDYASFYTNKVANVTVINAESDFPIQDASTITLEDDKNYLIGAPFTTSKYFVVGNAVLQSLASPSFPLITYTGTGSMFKVLDSKFYFKFMTVSCPNAVMVEVESSAPFDVNSRLNIEDVICYDCVGAFKSVNGGSIIGTNSQFANVSGPAAFDFGLGNVGIVSLGQIGVFNLQAGASAINLDPLNTIIGLIELTDIACINPNPLSHLISGGLNSINLFPATVGVVQGCNANGMNTPLVGITQGDGDWIFRDNENVPDSYVCANPYLNTTTDVTITNDQVYVKINSNNWSHTEACKLVVSDDGDITNNTSRAVKVLVNGFVTMADIGGGTDEVRARIVRNSNPNSIESEITENSTENSQATSVSLLGIFTLEQGDSVSLWVANWDDSSDIRVTKAKMTVLALA